MSKKVALVTGASSGIGRATALKLRDGAFTVYATARSKSALEQLRQDGLEARQLEVTDEAQRVSVISDVLESHGAVDVLVNNAGYSLQKPVEQASVEEIRVQLETNVIGPMRLVQLVLPAMREQGSGRVINVGSMGGRFTLPGGGFYHASKYALEALTDALRLEVSTFGVLVVLIEPGVVQSEFGQAAATVSDDELGRSIERSEPYGRFNAELKAALANAYSGSRGRFQPSVDDVARVIAHASTTRRPRTRYVVGLTAKTLVTARRLLPDTAWDALIRRSWPSN